MRAETDDNLARLIVRMANDPATIRQLSRSPSLVAPKESDIMFCHLLERLDRVDIAACRQTQASG